MHEAPKRRMLSKETLIRLFAKSNNRCNYLGCHNHLFDSNNNFLGNVCHIEGVLPGSARFNTQSNNERHDYEIIILLCRHHHAIVDIDIDGHSVQVLKAMKLEHESTNQNLETTLSEQALNSVRIGLYELNEKLADIVTTQNLSRHKEEPIQYEIIDSSRRKWSKKKSQRFNLNYAILGALILFVWIFFHPGGLSLLFISSSV